MAARARALGRIAAVVFVVAFPVAGGSGYTVIEMVSGWHERQSTTRVPQIRWARRGLLVAGAWLGNFHAWPWLWAAPMAGDRGAAAARIACAGRARRRPSSPAAWCRPARS